MKPRITRIHDRSQTNSHVRTAGIANVSEPMRIHNTSFHAPLSREFPTFTGKMFRNVWGSLTVRRVYGMNIVATYLSVVLQPFVGPRSLFQFLNLTHSL
jgi:hypothetical protein